MWESPQLRSLLQACKLEPTDDLARLALSDWLKENDLEELGEFVQLQVETDSDTKASDHTWGPKEMRQRRLMRDRFTEWFNLYWRSGVWCVFPHAPEIGEWEGVDFAAVKPIRGMLELHVKAEEVAECVAQIPERAHPWLETLSVTYDDVESLRQLLRGPLIDLFSCVILKVDELSPDELAQWIDRGHICHLRFRGNPSTRHLQALSELTNPRLRQIYLELGEEASSTLAKFLGCPLLSEVRDLELCPPSGDQVLLDLAAHANLSQIESLSFYGDNMGIDGFSTLFAGDLRNLRSLKVADYEAQPGLLSALSCSENLSRLQTLSVDQDRVNQDCAKRLTQSSAFESLKSLDLGDCNFSTDGASTLFSSESLSTLERLVVNGTVRGDVVAEALGASPYLSNLRYLSLCRSPLTAQGLSAIANAESLSNLEDLDLSITGLQGSALLELVRSTTLTKLRFLGMRSIACSGEVWSQLLRSPAAQTLTKLDIQSAPLGDSQVSAFAEAELPALRELITYENGLTDEMVQRLADAPWMSHLTRLVLSDNQVGDEGLRKILSRLTPGVFGDLSLWNTEISASGFEMLLAWPGLREMIDLDNYGNPIEEELATRLGNGMRRGPW